MALLDSSDYVSVRAALDTSLGKGELPDDMIALDLYAGEAQRWVASQITVTGSEATGPRAKLAAVYMTAALLAPAVSQIISQRDASGESVTLKPFDPVAKEMQLRTRAASMIELVNGGETADLARRPTSAIRQMQSNIVTICLVHRVNRSVCGCRRTALVF